jgi:tRNA (guanine26-N2/guanine27-N2)-dimethyltransferase
MMGVTATDTAPLCGAHLKAGIRRYMARPMNTDYHAEIGLRILLGYVARMTARYDRGIDPVFCFSHEHFVRLHLRLARGTKAADRTIGRLGYIYQCPHCPYRSEGTGMFPEHRSCPLCTANLNPIGPLWTGRIQDTEFVGMISGKISDLELAEPAQLARIIGLCHDEPDISYSYDYHYLAKKFKVSPGPISAVLTAIRDNGYLATRVHYSGYGIKTDAPLDLIRSCLTVQ